MLQHMLRHMSERTSFLKLRKFLTFSGSDPGAVHRVGFDAMRLRGEMEQRRAAPPQAARCASARVLRKRFRENVFAKNVFSLGNEIAGAPGRGGV